MNSNNENVYTSQFEKRVARYLHCSPDEVESHRIGQGSRGTVYRTEFHGKDMALKVVPVFADNVEAGCTLDDIRKRADGERKNIDRLKDKSDYLVSYSRAEIIEYYAEDGKTKIGFDYVTYMDLLEPVIKMDAYKNGTMSIADVKKLGRQICSAVIVMHDHGVMHRDINPNNIFFDSKTGVFKLGDFDCSKITESMRALTLVGGNYAAPEVILFSAPYDFRCDIYSLGKTLWHLFQRTTEFANTPKPRNFTPDVVSVFNILSKFDMNLYNVIAKAMVNDPDGRWESAQAMLDAMD